MYCCLLLACIFLIQCPVNRAETYNDTQTLWTTIFDTNGYNSKIRPVENQAELINITMTFYLSAMIDFDEQEESLTTSGYLSMYWHDRNLVWDPSHYNGLSRLFIPQDDIWKPDISLRNSYGTFKGLGSSYLNCWVVYDGTVYWEPFQVLKSTCSVDITYFPFDTQNCTLKFTAWSYTKEDINIQSSAGIELSGYEDSATWNLVASSSRIDNSYEASISYTISLQKKPLFYVFNMILPVILLSLLNVFTFVLPFSSGEKASYAVTVFLSLTVFLTIVASEFPKNSDNTSLLAIYLLLMIILSTVFVLLTVIELRLANRDDAKHPVGNIAKKFHHFVSILQCKCKRPKVAVSKQSIVKAYQESDVAWANVVNAMDFVFFVVGVFITFISTIVLMSLLINNPHKVADQYTY